ncbi:hypothetical protein P0W64_07975 [Tsukamurella sp. 8F]|uniref:hypothetical protein n=1 Tax=unclassified Tsukamurella TaxID=2633480 RepID=UPI0023B910B4|nr:MULTISPECIES: hypothetical protein [unclassified Tsukamurella]MDF0528871.1 hypothetical protein [Tsukamurella sp. 8J]MDF0586706.1 hypothetical protein [Tsukamurella sp. 8F]
MTLDMTARRAGLDFEIETARGGLGRVTSRFLRSGGTLARGVTSYEFTRSRSATSLRSGTGAVTAIRTGIGAWTIDAPGGPYRLRQGRGLAPSELTSPDGATVATVVRSGVARRSLTVSSESVGEPVALLALLTVLARRRRKARVVSAVR